MATAEWCGRPVIPGDWRDVTGDAAASVIEQIRSAELDRRGDLLRGVSIECIREMPLLCYPGATLVEAQAMVTGEPALSNHLRGHWGLVTLDGTSAPIHDLNDHGVLLLDTPESARTYHALFCNTVRAEGARFLTLTDANELTWYAAPDDAVFAAVSIGVRVERAAPAWRIEAPIVHGNALFTAWFELDVDGTMAMAEDDQIATDLPILCERWRGQYRLPPGRRVS